MNCPGSVVYGKYSDHFPPMRLSCAASCRFFAKALLWAHDSFLTLTRVQQEVALARVAKAIWGDFSIPFSEVAQFVCNVGQSYTVLCDPDLLDHIEGVPNHALFNVWSAYGDENWMGQVPTLRRLAAKLHAAGRDVEFILVLEASRKFRASNPLDYVYAFLAHPTATRASFGGQEFGEPFLDADYSISVDELNYRTASRLANRSLNFLVQVQHEHTEDSPGDIPTPSWIPQWHQSYSNQPEPFWEMWDASLRLTRKAPPESRIVGRCLETASIIVDNVTLRGETARHAGCDDSHWHFTLGKLLETWWTLVDPSEQAEPNTSAEDALAAFSAAIMTRSMHGSSGQNYQNFFLSFCDQFGPEGLMKRLLQIRGGCYSPVDAERMSSFPQIVRVMTNHRCFFTTRRGYCGLGPPSTQLGDVVAVLFGADVPFILRPVGDPKQHCYKLVGQCYVHGIMYGKTVEMSERGNTNVRRENIFLV